MFLLGACEGPTYSYGGYNMPDHFPLDGEREWEYSNESADYTLLVEKQEEQAGGLITLRHSNDDTLDIFFEVTWSTDDVDGVRIHSYEDVAHSGEKVTFNPPVQFMERKNIPGDIIITETGGYTFTSTFDNVEGCGTYWVPDWEEEDCLKMVLDDGDNDPSTNSFITGDYWLVTRFGAALFETDHYGLMWNLSDHDWSD